MAIEASKHEISNLSALQRELFTEDNHIATRFINVPVERFNWFASAVLAMSQNTTQTGGTVTVRFTPDMDYDYLTYSYLAQDFPAIRVKAEHRGKIQIAWTYNPVINTIQRAQMKIGNTHPQTYDSFGLDIYSQYYIGERETYMYAIGNNKLTEWSSELPAFTACLPQPWYYSRSPTMAIPLFICRAGSIAVEHTYTLRNSVLSLLRMRRLVEERANGQIWERIPANTEYLEPHLPTLPTPQLFGCHVHITNNERNRLLDGHALPASYTEDMVAADHPKPEVAGSQLHIKLETRSPCKAIFWMAENAIARSLGHYSNYTDNPDDVKHAGDPIANATLRYPGSTRFEELPSIHNSLMQPWYHFPHVPYDEGYHAHSFAYEALNIGSEVGQVLNNATLTLKLADPPIGAPNAPNPQCYHLRVRLLTMRKVEFAKEERGWAVHVDRPAQHYSDLLPNQ